MGLFDRIGRVVRANLNDVVSKAEDPEKILEQALIDMQENLIELRQAVARAIATQKRTEQQYSKNLSESNTWQQRAQLALQKGEESLAKEALVRKKSASEAANALKAQLDQQLGQVDTLKRNLIALESKISEAKTKKDMLKSRVAAARANEQLQGAIGKLGTSSAMGAFERMEEKVLEIESRSQAAAELGGANLESQFALLESGSDVDDELAAMKASLAGTPTPQSLPAGATPTTTPVSEVDAELEQLRRQLGQ